MLRLSALSLLLAAASACLHPTTTPIKPQSLLERGDRTAIIKRAQVWHATDVSLADMHLGAPDENGFTENQTIVCEYSDKELAGDSDKFPCAITPDDIVKVKYGRSNGEVYAEVAATRLLWAVGFGADRMYPVRVVCHGCSKDPHKERGWHDGTVTFAPATVERKMPGRELDTPGLVGWKWPELEAVDEEAGGAPRAQRDALKLLAVMIQHTDSKAQQQRLLCEDEKSKGADPASCEHPVMMLNDLGITFGRATLLNSDVPSSTDLEAWSRTRVWLNDTQCIGNISKSFSGTLNRPVISEEGRKFLADLLMQLTDGQLHDLFDIARFPMRTLPRKASNGSLDEWVAAFKAKRNEIATRSCAA